MMEIPLSRGLVTIVDDEDYERVVAVGKWSVMCSRGIYYANRRMSRPDGRMTTVQLHAFLTGWPLVDHRNGDGLDNRRANLREATTAQNGQNRGKQRNNTSGFKGVAWDKSRWRAVITIARRQRHLGRFDTREDAARAYDTAAREYFGEFACVNFPGDGERGAR